MISELLFGDHFDPASARLCELFLDSAFPIAERLVTFLTSVSRYSNAEDLDSMQDVGGESEVWHTRLDEFTSASGHLERHSLQSVFSRGRLYTLRSTMVALSSTTAD